MNRQLKFRIWDFKNKKFVNSFILSEIDVNQWDLNDIDTDYIFQQFTGLKDKNGLDIYEGDIVKHNHWSSKMGIVEYCVDTFLIKSLDGGLSTLILPEWTEIVGNIFENPDLIK